LRLIRACLTACGAPPDLLQVVYGYGEVGSALVEGPIDKITFVGSTQIGKLVMRSASLRPTPVVLELGGKDAFIVRADADLSQVVPIALRGAFQSAGQNCTGAERFFIHESILDEFLRRVCDVVKDMRIGPPLGGHVDMGAMCMLSQPAKIQQLIDDAVAKGARLVMGGKLVGPQSHFYPPTVLVGIKRGMLIWDEEVFGPVMGVATFSTDEEAVRFANDSNFGLGASVFTRDRAIGRAIASQMDSGMASINDFASNYMCQSLPFGGVKASGFDRFAGIEGLRGCCHIKSLAQDKWGGLIDTRLPPLLSYPVGESGFSFVCALCHLFYGRMGERLSACWRLAITSMARKSASKPKAS